MVPGAGNVVAAVIATENTTLNVFPTRGVTLNGAPPENCTVPVHPVGGTVQENATVPIATGATKLAAATHTGVCEATAPGIVITTLGSTSCAASADTAKPVIKARPARMRFISVSFYGSEGGFSIGKGRGAPLRSARSFQNNRDALSRCI
jgi:hypothetical protein